MAGEVRINLANHPTPLDNGGWNTYNNSLYVASYQAGAGRRAGTGARKYTRSASSPSNVLSYSRYMGSRGTPDNNQPLASPGLVYTGSIYMKAPVAFRVQFSFRCYDAAGIELIRVASSNTTAAANTWARPFCTLTAPANTYYISIHGCYVYTQSGNSVGGQEIFACDALIEQTDTLKDFFAGDYSPDPAYVPGWLGDPGKSASALYDAPSGPVAYIGSEPVTALYKGTQRVLSFQ